jgi:hypothetical protein
VFSLSIFKNTNRLDNQTYTREPGRRRMRNLPFMRKSESITGGSKRLKKQQLTHWYISRHITKARQKVSDGGFSYRKGNASYQQLIADLDINNATGTYCYHCRNLAYVNETVITHARCSLSRVYHEACGVLIKVWP